MELGCGHWLHAACILGLDHTQQKCPMCRSSSGFPQRVEVRKAVETWAHGLAAENALLKDELAKLKAHNESLQRDNHALRGTANFLREHVREYTPLLQAMGVAMRAAAKCTSDLVGQLAQN